MASAGAIPAAAPPHPPDRPAIAGRRSLNMAGFIIRRLLYMIPMMFAISVVTFIIIQLPPGDFLTAMTARLASQNETIDPSAIAGLRERYGLDQPWAVQYWKWISGIL